MNEPASTSAAPPRSLQADPADIALALRVREKRLGAKRWPGCLLALILVVGMVAVIAVPNFIKFGCRSKQSEARGHLKSLYVAEESYRAEYDAYSTDFVALGFTPRGAKLRYRYAVLHVDNEPGKQSFLAVAQVAEPFGRELSDDLWVINQQNALENTINGCR